MDISRRHEELMDEIYRSVFLNLAPGKENVEVTINEAQARYDFKEGVDLILTMENGLRLTVQEKLLTANYKTATFEEKKGNGEPGGWYYGTSQLYMVAYNRQYPDLFSIDEYMLLNFTTLKIEDILGTINWKFNKNKCAGRLEEFRYLFFDQIPEKCIVSQLIKKPLEFELPF